MENQYNIAEKVQGNYEKASSAMSSAYETAKEHYQSVVGNLLKHAAYAAGGAIIGAALSGCGIFNEGGYNRSLNKRMQNCSVEESKMENLVKEEQPSLDRTTVSLPKQMSKKE